MATLTFEDIGEARDFRDEHPDSLLSSDVPQSKTVEFTESELTQLELERAESTAARSAGEKVERFQAELSDDERRKLEARPNWTWRQNGIEARWAKGTLTAQGATEWLDFYEAGEGVEGALKNMESSAERAADTGAQTGQRIDKDPDPITQGRMQSVANAPAQQCDHAEGACRTGDPDACEFLAEECGYSETEIDELTADVEPQDMDLQKAKELHSKRSERAQAMDENIQAREQTTDFEKWSEAPNQMDFPGVDDVGKQVARAAGVGILVFAAFSRNSMPDLKLPNVFR